MNSASVGDDFTKRCAIGEQLLEIDVDKLLKSYTRTVHIDGVYKIDVSAEDLAANQETLKELIPAVLHSAEGDYYLDARVYYVFEVGENNKILEVAMWCHNENISGDYGVLVNGVTVEENPAFFRLIEPFLTEEAHDMLKNEMVG
jgi:hypothetical protein